MRISEKKFWEIKLLLRFILEQCVLGDSPIVAGKMFDKNYGKINFLNLTAGV